MDNDDEVDNNEVDNDESIQTEPTLRLPSIVGMASCSLCLLIDLFLIIKVNYKLKNVKKEEMLNSHDFESNNRLTYLF